MRFTWTQTRGSEDGGSRARRGLAGPSIALLVAAVALILGPARAQADWWSDNFQVHGYLRSTAYLRSRDLNLAREAKISSWRNEIDIEPTLHLYNGDNLRVTFFGVFRPTYDAVYDLNPHIWGEDAQGGALGSGPVDLIYNGQSFANRIIDGETFPGHGACVIGEFCLANSDTGSLFNADGRLVPAEIIDPTVFFGRVTAPVLPRGSRQQTIGGNATGTTYQDYLNSPVRIATYGASTALSNSLSKASMPLGTPLNYYAGAIGNASSLKQSSFDINRTQAQLAWNCNDNAHPGCFVREAYFDVTYKNFFLRIGKQQIVWGKTDSFRLQDNLNPVDNGYHNVFPSLEDRRIPQLALDAQYTFGDIGPVEDVSLEFAWIFDKFTPNQFGQCGEPYAFTAACEARADAGAHQLFNISLAGVKTVPWTFQNTEPGLRLEFRLPRPSVSVSLTAFWGRQDSPVARAHDLYSVTNPNVAALLFLQGLGATTVGTIETLAQVSGVGGGPGSTVFSQGFDPYNRSQVLQASGVLQAAWNTLFNVLPPSLGGCQGLSGSALAKCANPVLAFAYPWAASEFQLEYPRVLTLGGSADYQIPDSNAILRLEMAYNVHEGIIDTSRVSNVSTSDVYKVAIGIDRPTFIRFLNPDRTAFISFQTFLEHVMNYRDGSFGTGMIVPENSIISTLFMQNFWRNDSLILTNFVAYDWNARAWITGPSFRWVVNQNLYFDVGVNLLWGDNNHVHNIRDLCSNHTLSCLGNPSQWNAGQWQSINENLARFARAPWWSQQSFADQFMEDRDEIHLGVTYQF